MNLKTHSARNAYVVYACADMAASRPVRIHMTDKRLAFDVAAVLASFIVMRLRHEMVAGLAWRFYAADYRGRSVLLARPLENDKRSGALVMGV